MAAVMKSIKRAVKKAIGEKNAARWVFLRRPDMKYRRGGPFNGQRFRQRIFFDLLYGFPIGATVETGSCVRDCELAVFFPAVDAQDETGLRRGCAVLCREPSGADIDANIRTLVRAETRRPRGQAAGVTGSAE